MTEQTNRLSLLDHPIAQVLLRLVFVYGLVGAIFNFIELLFASILFASILRLLLLPITVLTVMHQVRPKAVQAVLKPLRTALKKALMILGWRSRLRAVLLLVFLVPTTLYLDGGWGLIKAAMLVLVVMMTLRRLVMLELFGLVAMFGLLASVDLMNAPTLLQALAILVARMAIVVASSTMLLWEPDSKESADARWLQGSYAGGGDYSGAGGGDYSGAWGGGCSGGGDGAGGGGCSGGGD